MKKTILIKRIIPLIVFILFAFVSFVYATEWNTNSQDKTEFNSTGFVQLTGNDIVRMNLVEKTKMFK